MLKEPHASIPPLPSPVRPMLAWQPTLTNRTKRAGCRQGAGGLFVISPGLYVRGHRTVNSARRLGARPPRPVCAERLRRSPGLRRGRQALPLRTVAPLDPVCIPHNISASGRRRDGCDVVQHLAGRFERTLGTFGCLTGRFSLRDVGPCADPILPLVTCAVTLSAATRRMVGRAAVNAGAIR